MRTHEMRAVYGLVLATVALALVVCVSVNSYEQHTAVELMQMNQPMHATMLKTEHYTPPNPFEDPELRPKYDIDTEKEIGKSKTEFSDARGEIKKASDIVKDVIEKLTKQDKARDELMDQAVEQSDRIHRVRHILINFKAEANGIQTHEDTNWVYTNPFGKDADPPEQDLKPFNTQIKKLNDETDEINKKLKDIITKCQSSRNDALELDSHVYNEIQKAKNIAADAVTQIHHHEDKVEMMNHEDYDTVHRVEVKLNDQFRIDRHRFHGYINLAQAMSARQPNEVSEVTALATDLLIVTAETQERLDRMQDVVNSIVDERNFRDGSGSSS